MVHLASARVRWMRRHLAAAALIAIASQLSPAGANLALLQASFSSAGSMQAADEECTCGHGPHAMCPMHHTRSASRRARDAGQRQDGPACKGCPASAPAFTLGTSEPGALEPFYAASTIDPQHPVRTAYRVQPLELHTPPDLPPPRA